MQMQMQIVGAKMMDSMMLPQNAILNHSFLLRSLFNLAFCTSHIRFSLHTTSSTSSWVQDGSGLALGDGKMLMQFFMSKPLPCDPSILPQYPPSKELNTKQRAEGAQRHGIAAGKGTGFEAGQNQNIKQPTKVIHNPKQPSFDGFAELEYQTKVQHRLPKQRSHSQQLTMKAGKFSPQKETSMGPPISYPSNKTRSQLPGPTRSLTRFPHVSSKSGPVAGPSWKKLKEDEICLVSMPVITTSSSKDKILEKRPKREGSGKAIAKYRSETLTLLERRSHNSEAFSEQDKRCNSLVVNSYNNLTTLRDRRSKELQASTKAAQGSRRQLERKFHSGPIVRPGVEHVMNVEKLADNYEFKMQRAARRAAQIAKEFNSIIGITNTRK